MNEIFYTQLHNDIVFFKLIEIPMEKLFACETIRSINYLQRIPLQSINCQLIYRRMAISDNVIYQHISTS